jgi:hypothetical protein
LHTQNNSVKTKVIRGLHLSVKGEAKTNYSQTKKKDEKGTHRKLQISCF